MSHKKHSDKQIMRSHSLLKASKRQQMVASRVFEVLSMVLLRDITDPALSEVSITHVDMSGDLQIARVFFVTSDKNIDFKPILEGFKRAEGYLKKSLANALTTKKTPELRFYADENIYAAWNLEELLNHTDKDLK